MAKTGKQENTEAQQTSEPEIKNHENVATDDGRSRSVRQHHARNDSRNVFWGVFLVFLGIMLLLNSLGVIPWTIWHDIWQYWPFLLIIAGIQVMLGSGPGTDIAIIVLSVLFFVSVFTKSLIDIQSPLVHQWGLDKLPWIEFLRQYNLK